MEVTTAGADTHPPNSLALSRLLFHNLSQRLELGTALPASLLPPQLILSFFCPCLLGWEEGACVWVGVLSPEHWGLLLAWVGLW